jgi:hypothetical protein
LQDYKFVSYTEGRTLTEGVFKNRVLRKYLGTRRRKQTEVRENCVSSFSSSLALHKLLLDLSG